MEAFLDAYLQNPVPDQRHSPLLAASLKNLPPTCKFCTGLAKLSELTTPQSFSVPASTFFETTPSHMLKPSGTQKSTSRFTPTQAFRIVFPGT